MPTAPESPFIRTTGLMLAFMLAITFFVWTQAYFEPLHIGVDQNGYLVGGKQVSRTLMPRQTPTVPGQPATFDPHAFVANMWVAGANDAKSFDPKYPIGLPLLYALTIWATASGTTLAFYVSPAAMALTLPAVFLVVRRFAGTFGGLLALLAFATSPLTAALTNNPNSHAVTLCLATWGMAAVLQWWHAGGRRWAVLGGLLVGCATTVRYTEGMLVLPLIWAAITRAKWGSPQPFAKDAFPHVVGATHASPGNADRPARATHATPLQPTRHADLPVDPGIAQTSEHARPIDYETPNLQRPSRFRRMASRCFEPMLLIVAWSMPVLFLASYNLLLLGTLTGYDSTKESTGFGWTYFFENWETLLRNMGSLGLFLLLPLAVVGLIRMAWQDARRAVFLLLWAGPCLGLYSFYYWGPDGVGILRFVFTALPPLLAGAFWGLLRTDERDVESLPAATRSRRVTVMTARVIGVSIAAGVAVAVMFYTVRYDRENGALTPLRTYFERPPTAYQRLGGPVAYFAGMAAFVACAAALAMTSRRTAAPLAAGAVALLSIAGSADASRLWLEQNAYDTRVWQATATAVQNHVPDGAMLVCREEALLHYLQFATDDRLYTGLSFDRNWVNGRPRAVSDDPVLIDPVRGQQLFDALEGFNQKALDEQARAAVRAALASNRRVFVVEPVAIAPMLQAVREKKDGPVPDFVRRYITRPKDKTLIGRRVGWWAVPQVVKDEAKRVPRGRKLDRPNFRTTCYQLWEITAG